MPGFRTAQPPGFEITETLKTWESTYPCPRCTFTLYTAKKDDIELSACGACGGVWLPTEQALIAKSSDSRVPEQLAKKVEKVTRARPWHETPLVKCPECQAAMARRFVGKVVIDSCSHGTWFDRDELATVMAFERGEAPPDVFSKRERRLLEWGPWAGVIEMFEGLLDKARGTTPAKE